ncbi:FAD-binding protein [Cryobacterium sp. TMS1-20-1]|uniref:FAD-binding protein n=1 Tax=unclassified Cryobacterium TaxID=2649013 RepID=UPI00106CABBC|nr:MULTISPECIES: FAD-binding protein [unclassified Cryobacterium]TFC71289.1 FAD-binding protein [Cryobacterium sp. TMS1-20-1]TFD59388.1 FAD-binding protein [Cryobacterium sp. Hh7]
MNQSERNWAGNYRYVAPIVHPTSVEQMQQIVAAATRVRALGSRHSFNAIADSAGTLVALDGFDDSIRIDPVALSVEVSGGTTYGTLAVELQRQGYALHNLASLPHISVAGAIATGTHGSGDQNGSLATAVSALEIVTASGELLRVDRSTPDFAGMVVGLGALGIVTRVTLDIQPSFDVRQFVYENLPWSDVLHDFDAVMGSAYSVSLFTDWQGETVQQAWVKSRGTDFAGGPEFFGGTAATEGRHPLPGISAINCTEQLGVAGPWSERLAHFRLAFTPSDGDELQSEYHVPREYAVAAIEAMRALSSRIAPLLLVSEIRSIAADDLWLSPSFERAGVALHFTWKPDQAAVEALLPALEAALAPFVVRPHWGKLFQADVATLATAYPWLGHFRALADRLDPAGKFRNAFLEHTVFCVTARV